MPRKTKTVDKRSRKVVRSQIIDESRLKKVQFMNQNQHNLHDVIMSKQISFVLGAAGTAKTFISMYTFLKLMLEMDNHEQNFLYDRIILVRPAVESEENLGFLPGELIEKMTPYLNVFYYTIDEILGGQTSEQSLPSKSLINENLIQPEPIAFMRGKTFKRSLIIADEAQNITAGQMKLLITRLGLGSKLVLAGDTKQSDIGRKTVLEDWASKLEDLPEVGVVRFGKGDVVRNPLIEKVLAEIEDE